MKRMIISFIMTAALVLSATVAPAYAAETGSRFASLKKEKAKQSSIKKRSTAESDLPESYSSRELGYCSSVKSQVGDVCWAFSSISSFETLLLKNNLYTADLNTNALDTWGSKREENRGWLREIRESGSTYIPIGNFTSWSGPVVDEDDTPKYGITELSYLFKGENDAIKRAIMKTGAVTGNLMSYSRAYSKDKNSYCLTDEININTGHSISVVGWDDNYGKENFDGNYAPKNDGAWLCKNSWGPEYNTNGGYIWVSYEDYYLFSFDTFDPSFSLDKLRVIQESDHIYQNEIYGATYELGYFGDDVTTYFNVFDFSSDGNVIEQVVFETLAFGADYTVYSVPLDKNDKPVNDRTKWNKLGEGTVDHYGFISCDTGDKILRRGKLAIAVELDTSNTECDNSLGVSEWLREAESKKMIFMDPVEAGKSFVTYKGEIVDVKDYYQDVLEDEIGGTLVIKAITNNTTEAEFLGDVDLNGVVDVRDATALQKYLAEIIELNEEALLNADMNQNRSINITDATAIRKYIAKSDE